MMNPPKVLPPHYFFAALALMVGIDYVEPSAILPGWLHLVGLIPIGVGVGLVVVAARQFSKADTNIVPLTRSTALVADGVFSFTRNPMYLGMTVVLGGTAVLLNSYLPWLVPIAFVLIIRLLFIRHEESLMEETLGAD
jgi:protein-S-isoprenylcysteine O-methyltransferase Ste14